MSQHSSVPFQKLSSIRRACRSESAGRIPTDQPSERTGSTRPPLAHGCHSRGSKRISIRGSDRSTPRNQQRGRSIASQGELGLLGISLLLSLLRWLCLFLRLLQFLLLFNLRTDQSSACSETGSGCSRASARSSDSARSASCSASAEIPLAELAELTHVVQQIQTAPAVEIPAPPTPHRCNQPKAGQQQ